MPEYGRTIAKYLYSDLAIVRPPIGQKSNYLENCTRDLCGALRLASCDPSTPFSSTPQRFQFVGYAPPIQLEYPFGAHVRCVAPPRVSPGTSVQSCYNQLLVNYLAISVQLWGHARAHVSPPSPPAHAAPRPPPPAPRRPRPHARVGAHGTVGGRPAGPPRGRRPPPAARPIGPGGPILLPPISRTAALRGSPVPRLDSPARGLNYEKNRNEIG